MFRSPRQEANRHSAQPNMLVRAISGMSVSIRVKLLVAFLGVTFLMAGLALVGLATLRQANDRTEKLIRDQERIAYFNEAYSYLSNLLALAAALPTDPADVKGDNVSPIFVTPGFLILSVSNNLVLHSGHGLREYGKQGMVDEQFVAALRSSAKELEAIAAKATSARRIKDYETAGIIAWQEFAPIASRLQGNVYSKVQEIEAEMAETARSTALAYKSSVEFVSATALISVGLALLLGYAISSSLVWPIQRIEQSFRAIAGGDFEERVAVPNRDELGELARNLNITSQKLGELYETVEVQRDQLRIENARSETLLNNLLPAQVAARLKADPDQEIADHLPSVAILFADIVDFTPRSARMAPEEIVSFLNRMFSAFDELAGAHGLEKIKTIGDSYMVAAGMPESCEKPAHRVAAMALDMMDAVKALPGNVELRIGLHMGPAVAGVIGRQKPFYDVWGETVNTASRMESHGEPGRVQVTDAIRDQLEGVFRFEAGGVSDIPGVGKLRTWWLEAPLVTGAG
ncbi:adenylate/guanylate cyclase domain-containing protein [Shimia sp. W99]